MQPEMSCTTLHGQLVLPESFRVEDCLSFHRRDPQQIAERVSVQRLDKGLCLDGQLACLQLNFGAGHVAASLHFAGGELTVDRLQTLVSHLLGLTQPVDAFHARFAGHPELGRLLQQRPGLRVPQTATPFEALTWAVTGQQISVAAAVSLRRKLILAANLQGADGLFCYPDAAAVLRVGEAGLRAAGFSGSKTQTLLALAAGVLDGFLPLDAWCVDLPVETVRERLLSIRGVGPWTVDYALMRGFGWLDGSLHGDAAVRRALAVLLGRAEIDAKSTRDWLAQFAPSRALVAAHLWASGGVAA